MRSLPASRPARAARGATSPRTRPTSTSVRARTRVRARAAARPAKNGCAGQERVQGQGRLRRRPRPSTSARARTRARAGRLQVRRRRLRGQELLQGQGRLRGSGERKHSAEGKSACSGKSGCKAGACGRPVDRRAASACSRRLIRGMSNRFGLPDLGVGVGLRTVHFGHILAEPPAVDWFEVLSENFMDTGGRPLYVLDQVAERYPVVLHGVSLSIGSTDPLDREYLRKLKALAARTRARWVSDHLCWTASRAATCTTCCRCRTPRRRCATPCAPREAGRPDILERPLVLENPSSYVEFARLDDDRVGVPGAPGRGGRLRPAARRQQRLRQLVQPRLRPAARTSTRIPADRVVQYHLAGHTNKGTHIIDTHSDHAMPEVWELYARLVRAHRATCRRSTSGTRTSRRSRSCTPRR